MGALVGVYSRALDPGYPGEKAPPYVRHDVWGRRGIFNPAALAGPELYLCEGAFDALAMVASGFLTAAALVGTKGLRWPDLGHVRELYLCLDADEEGRGGGPRPGQGRGAPGSPGLSPGPRGLQGLRGAFGTVGGPAPRDVVDLPGVRPGRAPALGATVPGVCGAYLPRLPGVCSLLAPSSRGPNGLTCSARDGGSAPGCPHPNNRGLKPYLNNRGVFR